ncbi:MAG: hypothetical protein WC197_02800 [Candidatus Gastranaerophilaceae bacterium]|jgi:hypothetical protein
MSQIKKKIVTVTPAGRSRFMKILVKYLLANRHIIDEHRWWVNTVNKDDLEYIDSLCKQYPDFFKAVQCPAQVDPSHLIKSVKYFYATCLEPHTVYIKIDDDIVWIEDGAIEKLVKCRLEYTEPLFISANVINNAVCGHLHERMGAYPFNIREEGAVTIYNSACQMGWQTPPFAEFVHKNFICLLNEKSLYKFKFPLWILWEQNRFSINCICFTGANMAEIYDKIGDNDEEDLTVTIPKIEKNYMAICGESLVSHYSFYTQIKYLEEETDLLSQYEDLADSYLSCSTH